MYAISPAVRAIDRRRLRRSALVSLLLWALFLPALSLIRWEGPHDEPSMNPLFVELLVPEPPPPKIPPPKTERVEIAEKASQAAAPRSPAPAVRPDPAPAAASERAAAPELRPDPSAAPTSRRSPATAKQRGGAEPLSSLSEEALKAAAPSAPTAGTPPPQARNTAETVSERTSSGAARPDSFAKSLGEASKSLSSTPSGAGGPSTAPAAAAGRADLAGGFDFGDGPARELMSPRRIRVPDKLLAGLPETVATKVSFRIDGGGTVFAGTIRFDPPLPDALASYLRTAFSAWLFSPADSDGQVVFRYSIKVR